MKIPVKLHENEIKVILSLMTYKLDIIKQLAKCLVSLSRFLYYNNSLLHNSYESGIEY
jgi:hypothetical protein